MPLSINYPIKTFLPALETGTDIDIGGSTFTGFLSSNPGNITAINPITVDPEQHILMELWSIRTDNNVTPGGSSGRFAILPRFYSFSPPSTIAKIFQGIVLNGLLGAVSSAVFVAFSTTIKSIFSASSVQSVISTKFGGFLTSFAKASLQNEVQSAINSLTPSNQTVINNVINNEGWIFGYSDLQKTGLADGPILGGYGRYGILFDQNQKQLLAQYGNPTNIFLNGTQQTVNQDPGSLNQIAWSNLVYGLGLGEDLNCTGKIYFFRYSVYIGKQ